MAAPQNPYSNLTSDQKATVFGKGGFVNPVYTVKGMNLAKHMSEAKSLSAGASKYAQQAQNSQPAGGWLTSGFAGIGAAMEKGATDITRAIAGGNESFLKKNPSIGNNFSLWVDNETKKADQWTAQAISANPVAQVSSNFAYNALYLTPGVGQVLATSNAATALGDYANHATTGKQLAGSLALQAINLAMGNEGAQLFGLSGDNAVTGIVQSFRKMGLNSAADFLETLGKSGVSSAVRTTAEDTGMTSAETAADTSLSGVTSEVRKAAPVSWLTKVNAAKLAYHIMLDGTTGTAYQISTDLSKNKNPNSKDMLTAFGFGATIGGIMRSFGYLGQGKYTDYIAPLFDQRSSLESQLNVLNQTNAPLMIQKLVDYADTQAEKVSASSATDVLSGLVSSRDDLIHVFGPIEGLEKMGITVKPNSDLGVDMNGDPINAVTSFGKKGKVTIEYNPDSPLSVYHEIGHAIDNYLKNNLSSEDAASVRSWVSDEVKQINPHPTDTAPGEVFAEAVKKFMTADPQYQSMFPKMSALISSTYGKDMAISDMAASDYSQRFVQIMDSMRQNNASPAEMDGLRKLYNSGADMSAIVKFYQGFTKNLPQLSLNDIPFEGSNEQGAPQSSAVPKKTTLPAPAEQPSSPVAETSPSPSSETSSPIENNSTQERGSYTAKNQADRQQKAIIETKTRVEKVGAIPGQTNSRTIADEGLQSSLDGVAQTKTFKELVAKQRGAPLTEAQIEQGARELLKNGDITPQMLLDAKPGSITTKEGIKAADVIIADSTLKWSQTMDYADSATGVEKTNLLSRAKSQLDDIMQMLANKQGMLSETAKTLQAGQRGVVASQAEVQAAEKLVEELEKTDPTAAELFKNNSGMRVEAQHSALHTFYNYMYNSMIGLNSVARTAARDIATSFSNGAASFGVEAINHPQNIPNMIGDMFTGFIQGAKDAAGVLVQKDYGAALNEVADSARLMSKPDFMARYVESDPELGPPLNNTLAVSPKQLQENGFKDLSDFYDKNMSRISLTHGGRFHSENLIDESAPSSVDESGSGNYAQQKSLKQKTIDFVNNTNQAISNFNEKLLTATDRLFTGSAAGLQKGILEREFTRGENNLGDEAAIRKSVDQYVLQLSAQNMPTGTAGEIADQILNFHKSSNVLVNLFSHLLVPFTRTSVNDLSLTADYFPGISAIRVLKNIAQKSYDNPRLAEEAITKSIIGMGLFSAGVDLVHSGALSITAAGPTSSSQKATWESEGKQPYSVKLGNNNYSYLTWGPLGSVLGAIGSFADAKNFGKDTKIVDGIAPALENVIVMQLNESFMSGMKDFITATQSSTKMQTYIGRILGQSLPVFPADIKQASQYYESATGQNYVRKTSGILQNMAYEMGLYDVPGLKAETTKVLGDTGYYTDIYGRKISKSLIYGLFWTSDTTDLATKTLLNENINFSLPISVNKIKVTGNDQMILDKMVGETVHSNLINYIGTSAYNSLPTDRKVAELKSVIDKSKTVAEQNFINLYPQYSGPSSYQKKVTAATSKQEDAMTQQWIKQNIE